MGELSEWFAWLARLTEIPCGKLVFWVHILPREVFHVALSSYKLTDNEVLTSVKGMSSYDLLTREHKHPWLTQGTPTVKQRQE